MVSRVRTKQRAGNINLATPQRLAVRVTTICNPKHLFPFPNLNSQIHRSVEPGAVPTHAPRGLHWRRFHNSADLQKCAAASCLSELLCQVRTKGRSEVSSEVIVGLVSCHNLSKGAQKLFHLRTGADRHPHECRQSREESSNFNTAIAHAVDDWPDFTAQIDHHEIRM
jgi:hypothetical protein